MPRFISINLDYLFYQVYKLFFSSSGALGGTPVDVPVSAEFGRLPTGAFGLHPYILFFLSLVTLLLLLALTYLLLKLRQSHINYEWVLYEKAQESKAIAESAENPKWTSISQFSSSENTSDWKIAVIEADKLLDDALHSAGAGGENLGERLKNFDSKKTPWLEDAWNAHKIRNRIAHETDFELTKYEIKKTIAKYERVLRELRAI